MRTDSTVMCDKCRTSITLDGDISSNFLTKTVRSEGWLIGKKDLCPDCRTRKPTQYSYKMVTTFPDKWNVKDAYETIKGPKKSYAEAVAKAFCRYRFGDDYQKQGISVIVLSRRAKS